MVNALVGCDAQRRFWVSAAEPKTVYTPRPESAPESESNALAVIYRRAIERYMEKPKGGPATAPNNVMKGSNDRATEQYRR